MARLAVDDDDEVVVLGDSASFLGAVESRTIAKRAKAAARTAVAVVDEEAKFNAAAAVGQSPASSIVTQAQATKESPVGTLKKVTGDLPRTPPLTNMESDDEEDFLSGQSSNGGGSDLDADSNGSLEDSGYLNFLSL